MIADDVCRAFHEISHEVFGDLITWREMEVQPNEVGVTDRIVLTLKRYLRYHVATRTFTGHEESVGGADWECWFTDGRSYVGFRFQAKIEHLGTKSFRQLVPSRDPLIQLGRLRRSCASQPGVEGYYLLYAPWFSDPWCQWCGDAGSGCNTITLTELDRALHRRWYGSRSIRPLSRPWVELVCPGTHRNATVVEAVAASIRETSETFEPTMEPPEYVRDLLAGVSRESTDDPFLSLLTVISEDPIA